MHGSWRNSAARKRCPFRRRRRGEVIRQSFRFADRHDRLSLRFSLVSDLIREAGY